MILFSDRLLNISKNSNSIKRVMIIWKVTIDFKGINELSIIF